MLRVELPREVRDLACALLDVRSYVTLSEPKTGHDVLLAVLVHMGADAPTRATKLAQYRESARPLVDVILGCRPLGLGARNHRVVYTMVRFTRATSRVMVNDVAYSARWTTCSCGPSSSRVT